ncbi:11858_t:CDS:2 [Acaulospora colombiana]|uniref:11858_t:CDS:1 n=1 Tax=Acaulospora colombiana TaxID=27376 RepID=A0ACA9LT68_9GLOM|nr:11858_t:CDS:2 [Acaulospora colombiana]
MTTEATSEKKPRKRKATEEVERKTNPGRAAKTKAEEAKAAASTSASSASASKSKTTTKKQKTEKKSDLPKLKVFMENAKDLKVVITQPIESEEDRSAEDKDKEGEEAKTAEKAETSKNGDSAAGEHLYTLEAKPQKNSTGSYGWTATIPKGKIKIHIDGKEVELPVTVNLNITVQGSKK